MLRQLGMSPSEAAVRCARPRITLPALGTLSPLITIARRRCRPHARSPRQVRQIIATLDVDGNGRIEWAEFSALMADKWLGAEGRVDIEQAAALFTDEEQMVNVKQFCEMMSSCGENPLSAEQALDLQRSVDPDNVGRLPLHAFLQLPCWQPPDIEQIAVLSSSKESARETDTSDRSLATARASAHELSSKDAADASEKEHPIEQATVLEDLHAAAPDVGPVDESDEVGETPHLSSEARMSF